MSSASKTIEIMNEAGIRFDKEVLIQHLQRFEEIVRNDERCNITLSTVDALQRIIDDAVNAELDACAALCLLDLKKDEYDCDNLAIRSAILSRKKTRNS